MTVSSSQSRVTISLNLTGQAATVRGVQAASAALQELTDVATRANEQLAASTDAAAAQVDAAQKTIADSAKSTAASVTASADTIKASQATVADTSEASAKRVTTASTAASGGIMGLLTSFKALSVGAATYLGVKSFTSYSTELTKLSTVAGLTQAQVAALNKEILATAPALRQSPTALAQAAYSPASERFGLSGTEQVMAYAAKLTNLSGAPIGGGAGSTSYAISTMMQALGMAPTPANVARVTAMIRGATSAGDMQMSDLTAAMASGVMNTGKTYGIDPEATLGALAYFTSQGVPAQEAATRMRMTESLLVGQTAQAAKYASALGLSVTGADTSALSSQLTGLGLSPTKMSALLRTGPGGLNAAFNLINQSISSLPQAQQEAVWAKLFGGGRTDATAMQLAQGASSGKLMGFINAVIGSSTVGGFIQAVTQYNQSPQGQLKHFLAELQTFATQFGAVVLPILQTLMNVLGPLLSLFAQHKALLTALTILIGGEMAFKLLGLVKNLKLVSSGLALIRDARAFDGIVSGATTAESAVGKLIQKLLSLKSTEAGANAAGTGGSVAGQVAKHTPALGALAIVAGGAEWLNLYSQMNSVPTASKNQKQAALAYLATLTPANAKQRKGLGFALSEVKSGYTEWGHGAGQGWAYDLTGAGFPKPPTFAKGGITDGPMAIVGEGSSRFPEYVVPTDPTYRGRALALWQGLTGQLLPGVSPEVLIALGLPKGTTTGHAASTATGAGGSNLTVGQRLAAAMGWTGIQWSDLDKLWQRESGWNNFARNPTSGAYGIPQALPPTKLPFAGQAAGGSNAAAQIQWGLAYVKQRYGDPATAWAHEQNVGWYARGGVLPFASYDSGGFLPEGLSIAHNGTGQPEPVGATVGAGGDLCVQVTLDRKVVGEATIKDFRRRAARR